MCTICHNRICPAGCPSAETVEYSCPACGAEYPEIVYTDLSDGIVGCDNCLTAHCADTYFPEHY